MEQIIIPLQLHKEAVVAPLVHAVIENTEVISFGLHSIEKIDPSQVPATINVGFFNFGIEGLTTSAEEKKAKYIRWLQVQGFRELIKGLRATLEEAYSYVQIFSRVESEQWIYGELEMKVKEIKDRANKLNFPTLLEEINKHLISPLQFEQEFQSFNAIRNCLEHRGGIVGAKDVDANGSLTLMLPYMKMYYQHGEEEKEMVTGSVLTGDTAMMMKRETRERVFNLNDTVAFTTEDFVQISLACYFFAEDLKAKLPVKP